MQLSYCQNVFFDHLTISSNEICICGFAICLEMPLEEATKPNGEFFSTKLGTYINCSLKRHTTITIFQSTGRCIANATRKVSRE